MTKKSSRGKRKSSLNKHYFGDWSFQSEGGKDFIFLVDEHGLVKKIEPKIHSQKRRFMSDGRLVDKNNSWFGPRSIPFSRVDKTSDTAISNLLENWNNIKKSFQGIDYTELKKLSSWFNNLGELDKCEMIDVLIECEKFKELISLTGAGGEIKRNFRLNLERLSNLSSRRWDDRLPKFSEIIGYKGIIFIAKLQGFEDKFGSLLNVWLQEEVDKELKKFSSKETQKINGVHFIRTLLTGEKFADGCQEYAKKESYKQIFGECFSKSQKNFKQLSKLEGEHYFFPKVIDVIKAGQMFSNPTYAPSKYSLEGSKWVQEKNPLEWKQIPQELVGEVVTGFEQKSGWKGIIDASCSNVKAANDWLSFFVSFASKVPVEQMGCWEFYNLFFSKENFEQKRWCLFELPKEAPTFLKETNIFGPFYFSSWGNKNKFWAKCFAYEI